MKPCRGFELSQRCAARRGTGGVVAWRSCRRRPQELTKHELHEHPAAAHSTRHKRRSTRATSKHSICAASGTDVRKACASRDGVRRTVRTMCAATYNASACAARRDWRHIVASYDTTTPCQHPEQKTYSRQRDRRKGTEERDKKLSVRCHQDT